MNKITKFNKINNNILQFIPKKIKFEIKYKLKISSMKEMIFINNLHLIMQDFIILNKKIFKFFFVLLIKIHLLMIHRD